MSSAVWGGGTLLQVLGFGLGWITVCSVEVMQNSESGAHEPYVPINVVFRGLRERDEAFPLMNNT